jgi:hypothetical protein
MMNYKVLRWIVSDASEEDEYDNMHADDEDNTTWRKLDSVDTTFVRFPFRKTGVFFNNLWNYIEQVK